MRGNAGYKLGGGDNGMDGGKARLLGHLWGVYRDGWTFGFFFFVFFLSFCSFPPANLDIYKTRTWHTPKSSGFCTEMAMKAVLTLHDLLSVLWK